MCMKNPPTRDELARIPEIGKVMHIQPAHKRIAYMHFFELDQAYFVAGCNVIGEQGERSDFYALRKRGSDRIWGRYSLQSLMNYTHPDSGSELTRDLDWRPRPISEITATKTLQQDVAYNRARTELHQLIRRHAQDKEIKQLLLHYQDQLASRDLKQLHTFVAARDMIGDG